MKICLNKYEFLLKWAANLVIIAATVTTAFDITPLNKILFLLGCGLWACIGVIWKQPSLWTLNLFCAAIYILGFIN
jgi:hypothetical protein